MLGDVELFDIENETTRKVTVTEGNLRAYKRLFAEHQQSVGTYCRNYALGCTQSSSRVAFDDLVLRMMRAAGAVG
jgi:hypothetical protein